MKRTQTKCFVHFVWFLVEKGHFTFDEVLPSADARVTGHERVDNVARPVRKIREQLVACRAAGGSGRDPRRGSAAT
jgi:hypothetical protein